MVGRSNGKLTPRLIWVTDPTYERRFLAKPNGTHSLGECYITVSLGEPYNGATDKLVAAIVFRLLKESGAKRIVDVRLNNSSQLAGFAKRDDLT